jgi:hypothetical protein
MPYELHYWPRVPGRGEFVRPALAAAGADYARVCRGDPKQGLRGEDQEGEALRRAADSWRVRLPKRRLAACLASERRLPFHEQGIFRHSPEPDA